MTSRLRSLLARAALVAGGALLWWLGSAECARRTERTRRDELSSAAQWDLEHAQPEQALEKLRALEKTEPGRTGLQQQLGRALVATGRASEAIPVLTQVASQPNAPSAEALEYLGVAYSQLGNTALARTSLERAVELEPLRTSAWRRLAQARLNAGDISAAVAAWQKALEVGPSERPSIRVEATTLLTQAGKGDEANLFAEERDR